LVCTPRVAARLPLVASSQESRAALNSSMRLVLNSMIWMNGTVLRFGCVTGDGGGRLRSLVSS
jgi:hypothetical protein